MKKIYLVDSENVGDVWVPLLVTSQPEDQVLVFYTQKSPHMNYENVRMLKETEKEAHFIKCFEGSNALDFQLVTELGYRMKTDTDCEYIIVSNDTGFDAVVRYWTAKKMPVKRLSGKDCSKKVANQNRQAEQKFPTEQRPKTDLEHLVNAEHEKEPAVRINAEHVLEQEQVPGIGSGAALVSEAALDHEAGPNLKHGSAGDAGQNRKKDSGSVSDTGKVQNRNVSLSPKKDSENETGSDRKENQLRESEQEKPKEQMETTDEEPGFDEKIIKNLFFCINKENLADFHNALVMFFGEEKGKELYQEIKNDTESMLEWGQLPECSQAEKFEIYCKMVFEHSELAKGYPEDFSAFLLKSNGKRKNLNSLRAALQGQYGKDKGMKYYSLFKSHIKVMNRM